MADTLGGKLQRMLQGGPGRDLRRQRRPRVHEAADRGVPHDDHIRLRSGAHAGSRQGAVRRGRRLRTSGPSAGQVADAQAALRRDLETDSRQNGTLLSQLVFAYQYDEPIPDPVALRGLYDQLSVPLLRDAARTYLDPNRYVKVVLVPEAK